MEDSKNTTQPGLFERGGKLGFLHSSVDAFDTFLRVPGTVTSKGAHVRDAVDLKRIMIIVVVALIPAALFGMWNVGYQHCLATGETWGLFQNFWYGFLKVLPLYIVAYVVGLGIEFASAQIR
ncbi:MAG: RnfABCDGE type electron transport complex subunit D, partial [Bacteroides sp.]|nr:RnfABCDGE type electron transport complex subunit D [Bacteroides sp.]